jgi:hypothetical protein
MGQCGKQASRLIVKFGENAMDETPVFEAYACRKHAQKYLEEHKDEYAAGDIEVLPLITTHPDNIDKICVLEG